MCGRVLWAGLAVAAIPCFAQPPACRTPLDIPCHTVRGTHTQWEAFRTGFTDVRQVKGSYVGALRRDGSSVSRHGVNSRSLFSSEGSTSDHAWFYLAPQEEIVSVDHTQRTIARREPLIWHDRPYRRSVEGDATCKSGILHSGTDFRMTGEDQIAGVRVVRWYRDLGNGGEEEQYLAPSLDCMALKLSKVHRNALRLPTFILSLEVTSVEFGDPNSDLFALPSDYREIEDPRRASLIRFLEANRGRGAIKSKSQIIGP